MLAKKPMENEQKPVKEETKTEPSNAGLIYILVYFFTWLSGIIAYFLANDDKTMKFHAVQAILLGVVIMVCSFLFFLLITPLIGFVLWLYGLYVGYKASTGETIRIPYLAEFADKYS